MSKKVLTFASGLIAFLMCVSFWPHLTFSYLSPEDKLSLLIEGDLRELAEKKLLPKNWKKIRSVELSLNHDQQKHWLEKLEFPVQLHPSGNYHLEIQVLPWVAEGEYGVTINYHLVRIQTQTTDYELGRTFIVGEEGEIHSRL